eukprot:scaffold269421_cov18-Tisochrysis_lutea.AAC.1
MQAGKERQDSLGELDTVVAQALAEWDLCKQPAQKAECALQAECTLQLTSTEVNRLTYVGRTGSLQPTSTKDNRLGKCASLECFVA